MDTIRDFLIVCFRYFLGHFEVLLEVFLRQFVAYCCSAHRFSFGGFHTCDWEVGESLGPFQTTVACWGALAKQAKAFLQVGMTQRSCISIDLVVLQNWPESYLEKEREKFLFKVSLGTLNCCQLEGKPSNQCLFRYQGQKEPFWHLSKSCKCQDPSFFDIQSIAV